MAASEEQAQKLLAEAEKKIASAGKTGLSGLFGGSSTSKMDEAVELYCKAANLFKMAKNWNDAAGCFAKAARSYAASGNKHEAFLKFSDASNCFRKVNPARSVECLKEAVAIQTEMGRFAMAAKTLVSRAHIPMYNEKSFDFFFYHLENKTQNNDYPKLLQTKLYVKKNPKNPNFQPTKHTRCRPYFGTTIEAVQYLTYQTE